LCRCVLGSPCEFPPMQSDLGPGKRTKQLQWGCFGYILKVFSHSHLSYFWSYIYIDIYRYIYISQYVCHVPIVVIDPDYIFSFSSSTISDTSISNIEWINPDFKC
jgi:hypothetical protein